MAHNDLSKITKYLTIFFILALFPIIAYPAHASSTNTAADLPIYGTGNSGDLLKGGWSAQNTYGKADLTNREGAYQGPHTISWTARTAFDEFSLVSPTIIDTSQYQYLNIAVKISQAGQRYTVSLLDQNGNKVGNAVNIGDFGTLLPNSWKSISIPLAQLGGARQIKGILFREANGGAQPPVYIDEIALSRNTATPAPPNNTASSSSANLEIPEEEAREYSPKISHWLFLVPLILLLIAVFFS